MLRVLLWVAATISLAIFAVILAVGLRRSPTYFGARPQYVLASEYNHFTIQRSDGFGHVKLLAAPTHVLLLGTSALPLYVGLNIVLVRLRRHFSRDSILCPTCGYDLRATPHRCPECGTETGR